MMSTRHAPIAFFAYNRPDHAARTLAALAANPEAARSDLHVFVDGPRTDQDRDKVEEVVRIARATTGFGSITVHASTANAGLFKAITCGVSDVLSSSGRVIVVEDDILVSPRFLAYMNEGLERFENEPAVGSLHGYSPPLAGLPEFFFLRGGDCWGWATWADRWRQFDENASALLGDIVRRGQLAQFAATCGIPGLRHLIRRRLGRNQSWAALWNASLFRESRLTLHPGRSFVMNIGNDGSGTHSLASSHYDTPFEDRFSSLPVIGPVHDAHAAARIREFYEGTIRPPLPPMARALYRAALMAQARALSLSRSSRRRTATFQASHSEQHSR